MGKRRIVGQTIFSQTSKATCTNNNNVIKYRKIVLENGRVTKCIF